MKGKMLLFVGIMVVALGLVGTPASWASLTVDGITFTFSVVGGNLQLNIAGTGTGGYAGVNNLEGIALGKDTFGTATLATTANVNGAIFTSDNGSGGTFNNLNATGCTTAGGVSFGTCFAGSTTFGTTFNINATFTKTAGTFDASAVDLKICFSKDSVQCQGSLVSQVVPGGGGGTPEPASLMLLGAGLAGIGIWRWKAIRA